MELPRSTLQAASIDLLKSFHRLHKTCQTCGAASPAIRFDHTVSVSLAVRQLLPGLGLYKVNQVHQERVFNAHKGEGRFLKHNLCCFELRGCRGEML